MGVSLMRAKSIRAVLLLAVFCVALGQSAWGQLSQVGVAPPNIIALTGLTTPPGGPVVIGCMGQSNAEGADPGGSKTLASNIFIANDLVNPTQFVQATFGQAPLNNSLNGVTTDPSQALNNQCVQMANYLANSPFLAPNTPVIVLPNWFSGQSITNWVSAGTSSPYWVDFQNQINLLYATYPSAVLNYVVWDQGEADADQASTAYNSEATYEAGFGVLLSQLKALPQWTDKTMLGAVELGPWGDNSFESSRNDFLYKLRDGAYDPRVTLVSGAGLVPSVLNPSAHYSGAALVTLGQRHFETWLTRRIDGHFGGLSNTIYAPTGGLDAQTPYVIAPEPYQDFMGSVSGSTLTISTVLAGTLENFPMLIVGSGLNPGTRVLSQLSGTPGGVGTYLLNRTFGTIATETLIGEFGVDTGLVRSGAFIDANGGYLAFPNVTDFNVRSPHIYVHNNISAATSTRIDFKTFCPSPQTACVFDEARGLTVTAVDVAAGYTVDAYPFEGIWRVSTVYPRSSVAQTNLTLTPGVTFEVNSLQQFNNMLVTSGNTVIIDNRPGTFTTLYNASTTTPTTIAVEFAQEATGKVIVRPDGTSLDTGNAGQNPYVVPPGATVTLQGDPNYNLRITYDSSLLSHPANVITVCASGCTLTTTANVATYTPTYGVKTVDAYLIAGGGGGGGGAEQAASTAVSGGAGGGGGGINYCSLTAAQIGASQVVTVPNGGTPGAAAATNSTAGGNAGLGGNASIGTLCLAYGGGGGAGGQLAAGSGGGGGGGTLAQALSATGSTGASANGSGGTAGGSGTNSAASAIAGGGVGGAGGGSTGAANFAPSAFSGGGGGGSGAGITSGNAAANGGSGGQACFASTTTPGGAGAGSTGYTPSIALRPVNLFCGGGGAGGASSTTAAFNGGNGGFPGGGVGGAGSTQNGGTAGTGGTGGAGMAILVERF